MPRPPVTGPGPLEGLRVLDFSRVLSGPHCTRMLADLGADVIKVEPPAGDLTRFAFPRINSISSYFTQQNTGKRNISLDMKQPEAVELLLRLAEQCDVVVENFRPGVMDRMGLGYDVMAARNPRLVYATITGYGVTGPWVQRRAYAAVINAESGVTWLQGHARGDVYANDPIAHGDVYTGLECLAGVLAALYQRERTGRGQWVEVSMAETMLSVNEHVHWELQDIDGSADLPSFQPGDYPILTLGNGQRIVLAGHPAAKGNFDGFCTVMGRDDLRNDPRLATIAGRREHLGVIIDALQQWAGTYDSFEKIEQDLSQYEIPAGRLRTVREVAESDWAEARGAVVEVDDRGGSTLRLPNSPWHFSDAETGMRGRPSYRGEENRQVLTELLGLGDADVDRLEADGVLSSRGPVQRGG